MSTTTHVFAALVTLSSLLFIARLLRRRQLRAKYAALWLTLGAAMALLAAFPALLDRVSLALGVAYPPTTLFLSAIVLLVLVCVHFSWELSRLEERTRTLAEELALLRADADA